MPHITQLAALIKSLSKSEKRYFKCYNPGKTSENFYFSLYDILINQSLSEEQVKHKFLQKYPDAVLEPACKHLYKMLMRCLRSYEADKSVENKLIALLNDVKILFNKGILELCFSEIDKAKALAWQNEKFNYYLLFARMELLYLTSLEFPNTDENALVEKQIKINEILYHEIFINRHTSLYELVTYRYLKKGSVRNDQAKTQLNDLLLEEFQINASKKYDSFESDKLHLLFQSAYFLMTDSPEQSLQILYKLNNIFQKNKPLWTDNPVHYIYLLHGIITDLQLMRRYSDMEFFLAELQQVHPHANSLQLLIKHLIYYHRLGILANKGAFDDALTLVQQYQLIIMNKNNSLPPNAAAAMDLRLAVIYFGLGQYSNSLNLVNKVLNSQSKFFLVQQKVLGRLIHLLLHIELQNDDYLVYEVKSLERKLKSGNKNQFTLEQITLSFLKKWLLAKDRFKALQLYEQALQEISESSHEIQLLQQFPFISWAQAKLQKVPLSKILQTTVFEATNG